jgi:hypothetical protein
MLKQDAQAIADADKPCLAAGVRACARLKMLTDQTLRMDRINFDLATDRARQERLDAERQALKAVGVASFHCYDCDHYLPYRERDRRGRCWSCQRTRKIPYQRKYLPCPR